MILVTGATGNIGRHVVGGLLARGLSVRAMTRDPAAAGITPGAEVTRGDLAEPAGLPLNGVEAVYLMAMGGAPAEVVERFERAGVRRVVLLSTADVLDGVPVQPDEVAVRHHRFEAAIAASGLEWTFLRPNELAGNALHWAPQIAEGDVVRAPFPLACTVPIHERDVADVAVEALVGDGHHGAKYALTGPAAITHADQLRLIGAALGRSLTFAEIAADEAREQMTRYAPAPIVDAVLGQLAAAVARPYVPTGVVEEVTGRPPRGFADWAAEHAADFG
ncbi:SDR family oxidoreductase [Amycolatopsis minnesotensis]|uniref:NAD(P)H-binding protein n=1 Tax=Amycolatopsis minnesotensis TaxID=337894 RepID=A0ABP5E2Q5_9PSEU